MGTLYQRFERLKLKLAAEGLFDEERKRPLPVRPRKIAVVTSETGAVWHDICHVAARRDPGVPIVLIPAAVQGETAAAEIVVAIQRAAQIPQVDVLIVGRGGGSMEDLWCFNEEIVARAICACPIPVISAVGHETDFTIADFVADVRASTPSNASEMAVPDRSEVRRALALMRRRFDACAQERQTRTRLEVAQLRRRLEAIRPEAMLEEAGNRLALDRVELERLMDSRLQPLPYELAQLRARMETAMDRQLRESAHRLAQDRVRLEAASPQRVLERGYAYVTGDSGAVTSAEEAPEHMRLHFRDGEVKVHRE